MGVHVHVFVGPRRTYQVLYRVAKFGVSNGELMVRRHRLTDEGRLHAKHAERSTTKLLSPHASPSHFRADAGSLRFRVL